MFIRNTAVAIVVGMVLLLLLSKLIGRVQFSLSTAFWCSFIGHIFTSIVGLFTGWFVCLSPSHRPSHCLGHWMGFPRPSYSRLPFRAKGGTLQQWRAAILSGVVILGDFFVALAHSSLFGSICAGDHNADTGRASVVGDARSCPVRVLWQNNYTMRQSYDQG